MRTRTKGSSCPYLECLEARLPPGDTLLAALVGAWSVGTTRDTVVADAQIGDSTFERLQTSQRSGFWDGSGIMRPGSGDGLSGDRLGYSDLGSQSASRPTPPDASASNSVAIPPLSPTEGESVFIRSSMDLAALSRR
jgi:hypothetical protein